jgi:hypothetical protein
MRTLQLLHTRHQLLGASPGMFAGCLAVHAAARDRFARGYFFGLFFFPLALRLE